MITCRQQIFANLATNTVECRCIHRQQKDPPVSIKMHHFIYNKFRHSCARNSCTDKQQPAKYVAESYKLNGLSRSECSEWLNDY